MRQKTTVKLILLFSLISINLLAKTTNSEKLVTEAWQAWEKNDHQQVEDKFLAAIEADKNNTRAYLGLYFMYALQDKGSPAWEIFKNVLQTEENYYPYIYALWSTDPMTGNYHNDEAGIIPLFEELAQKADSQGILKAMANAKLGTYYEQKKEFAKAGNFYRAVNHIQNWKLIGPFDNISASGFEKVYPPEFEYDPTKTYEGKNDIPAVWFEIGAHPNYQWINFRYHFAYFKSVFYANNFVYSPSKQTVQIRLGTSGSLKIFLNDEQAFEYFDENNNDLDTYIVETELQEGWNRLLLKCGFSEISRCNFLTRITDTAGEPVEGLKISIEPQEYPIKPGARATPIDNFAEAFFKKKVKQNPNHLENYILLAESYLRNDKAVEGELALREAIRLSPNCALFQKHILEAYRRGEKEDERATTFEKIYSLDKKVPWVLEYKINKYLGNEEFEKAEELIKHLETLLPNSETVFEYYITLYAKKKQLEEMFKTIEAAYQKYPLNWTIASTEATIAILTKQDYDRGLEVYNNYLKDRYSSTGLSSLANTYLKASNLKKWEETFHEILKLNPVAPGYFSKMAGVYQVQQAYDKAEKMIKKAIEICPNSSIYWARLGEIYRGQHKIKESKQAFNEVLKYHPTNYEAREKLRELNGKKSIFHQFETADIEELIKNAPGADDYPNDSAIFLLREAKRVIYERGASQTSDEILIRVFNNAGLDDFKEYWIDYNSNSQTLTIEKAVVIKSDGSEIKADIADNHIVFKSLEVNDFIYIKHKIKNFFGGRLAKHFWDSFYFNTFYPSKMIRYSILIPKGQKFHIKVQNMPNKPVTKETEEGSLYQWSANDEPSIVYEYGMPILDDVGKMLFISSIDDWQYFVDWYIELAQTKTRSSHEIKEQMAMLFQEGAVLTEAEKIETIYNFITENIRYSSISFRQSNFVPQKARDVLVSKIGDCKDMTTLGIAMLNEIGVKANFVLLNTKDEGLNKNVLPSIAFNHCIAAVETEKGLKYLDFTGYNFPMESLPEMDRGGFSLVIKPGIQAPQYLSSDIYIPNNVTHQTRMEVNKNNSVSLEFESVQTGTMSAAMRYYYRNKGQEEMESDLIAGLNADLPNVKLDKFAFKNLDSPKETVELTYNCEVPNYITEAGQFKFLKIPWTDKLQTDDAFSYEKRKYPYYYWPWVDTTYEEIEIRLPAGYEPVDLVPEIKLTSSMADFTLQFVVDAAIIKATRKMVYKKGEIDPAEYSKVKEFYNAVLKEDNKQLLLRETGIPKQ